MSRTARNRSTSPPATCAADKEGLKKSSPRKRGSIFFTEKLGSRLRENDDSPLFRRSRSYFSRLKSGIAIGRAISKARAARRTSASAQRGPTRGRPTGKQPSFNLQAV